MCVTTQYLFSCGHAATHRFRTELCGSSKSRKCHVKDINKWLAFTCRKCSKNKQGWWKKQVAGPPPGEEEDDEVWYVPSRCFVDIGFSNLDPFAANGDEEELSPRSSSPEPVPLTPRTRSRHSYIPQRCENFLNRMARHKKPSDCCDAVARRGAVQAVRLEGRSDRVGGRIVDNHCESIY